MLVRFGVSSTTTAAAEEGTIILAHDCMPGLGESTIHVMKDLDCPRVTREDAAQDRRTVSSLKRRVGEGYLIRQQRQDTGVLRAIICTVRFRSSLLLILVIGYSYGGVQREDIVLQHSTCRAEAATTMQRKSILVIECHVNNLESARPTVSYMPLL